MQQTVNDVLASATEQEQQLLKATWPDPQALQNRITHLQRIHPEEGPRGILDRLLFNARRAPYQRIFAELLLDEPALRGRVLDIGCGADVHACLRDVPAACAQLDGVDPDEKVLSHPKLTCRWHGTFERSDIPLATYDAAYAFNVVEHIEAARPFFEKLAAILKPGGVFWALTPHSHHPFAVLSRTVEVLGGKRLISRYKSASTTTPPTTASIRGARCCGISKISASYRQNSGI